MIQFVLKITAINRENLLLNCSNKELKRFNQTYINQPQKITLLLNCKEEQKQSWIESKNWYKIGKSCKNPQNEIKQFELKSISMNRIDDED